MGGLAPALCHSSKDAFANPEREMQPLPQPRCRIVGGAACAIVSGSIKGKKPKLITVGCKLLNHGLCDTDENQPLSKPGLIPHCFPTQEPRSG